MDLERLRSRIRCVPDFPKPGIIFRDITPLLADAEALDSASERMAGPFLDAGIDLVLGIESRGFIFAPLVARRLHAGFVPVRKLGRLPAEVLRETYALEYGVDSLEMHADAVGRGHRVVIVDDVMATGGTAEATCRLAERAGADVMGLSFLIELTSLGGRTRLAERKLHSVIQY